MQARAGDKHCLGVPTDLVGNIGAEVLDDDLRFLPQVIRVQAQILAQSFIGLFGGVLRVISRGLPDPVIRLVRGVVLQHVEDEALFDGLTH